jgi:hypothetical protein
LRLRLAAFAPVVLVACAMAATPPDWRARDLGGFTLHTPADMQLRAGGDYDFGLYADPLVQREDALDYQSGAAIVDGMSARQVHFRLQDAAGQSRSCIGVHVPQVRQSGTGPLSLTMLACADKADDLKDVPAMFASIRITGSRSR